MKRTRHYKGEITKLILATLRDTAIVLTVAGFAGPKAPMLILRFAKYKIWYLRRRLKYLHSLNLIELTEDHKGRIIAKISASGEARMKRDELWNMKLAQPSVWDGLWRVVAFDVPTEKHISRDHLRQHLKALGFHYIQKSIFACPYPCDEELRKICEYYEIEAHATLLLATSLGLHEKSARRKFKLLQEGRM